MSMAVCDMEESKVNYTTEEIDALLNSGALKRLGMGARRSCYALPGGRLCVKCYRSDEEIAEGKHPGREPFKPLPSSVVREIRRRRFDERRNTCCQEYEYWKELATALPKDIMAVFPATMEKLFLTSRGWCVVEELMSNADGSSPVLFFKAFHRASPSMRIALAEALDGLVGKLERFSVKIYDPQNLLVQRRADGLFSLRIADFEPESRTFIDIDGLFPSIARMKLRRRFARYRRMFGLYGASLHVCGDRRYRRWDELIATEGAKLGLSDCRPFLEKKLVNDIFYEGLFKGKPCVVKCSSRAPESIANEYELGTRLYSLDPLHFPAVYAYHPGPFAFVVVEKIEGGKSLVDDPDGRYADEIVAILDSLHAANVVHRDMLPANFLISPDGHLKLIDFQFAVDMDVRRIDPWLEKHPEYHFGVFAAVVTPDGAWWDDAAFAAMLLPGMRGRLKSRIGRLRFKIPFTPLVRFRLRLFVFRMRVRRMFTPNGSRRRQALDRRLERFK